METSQPLTTPLASCLSMGACSGGSISECPADDIDVPVERFIDYGRDRGFSGVPPTRF